jgi:hypothetical protein
MRMKTVLLLPIGLGLPLAAQQPAHPADPSQSVSGGGVFPPGWQVRPDEGGQLTAVKFVTMTPGFHLTMGTAAILYRNTDRAVAPFRVKAKLDLFPTPSAHQEGYGLFIGGSNLAGADQRSIYFLIRGDGTFKVKRRSGSAATDVSGKDWTAHPAIIKPDANGRSANELEVSAGKDRVAFLVNGQAVYSLSLRPADTDGFAGLRVNHNLSIHVEWFRVEQ